MSEPTPRHRVPLCDRWDLWRTGLLRSAGFPFESLAILETPAAAREVDRALEEADPRRCAERLTEAEAVYLAEWARASAALRESFRSSPLRLAIRWQNGALVDNATATMARVPAGSTNYDARKAELPLVRYLQRYAAKNDTIGFFGPFAWLEVGAGAGRLSIGPGEGPADQRYSRREVWLEGWALERIVERISEDEELRLELRPRRSPLILAAEGSIHLGDRRLDLDPLLAAILAGCTGHRTARELVAELAADPAVDPDEVLEGLHELAAARLIAWSLPLDPGPRNPLTVVIAALDELPASAARDRAQECLRGFADHCRALAEVEDEPTLAAQLGELNQRFTALTGLAPSRDAGRHYAGRTLAYEDRSLNLRAGVGRRLLEEIAPALDLVLCSARWYAAELGAKCQRLIDELGRDGPAELSYFALRERLAPLFDRGGVEDFVAAPRAELDRRWAELLPPTTQEALELRSADLSPRAELLFPAAEVFAEARWHAPDLMIAAASIEAIERGDYRCVLGELHAAANTVLTGAFLALHDRPEQLFDQAAMDIGPGLQYRPAFKDLRHQKQARRSGNWELLEDLTPGAGPTDRWLAPAELIARRDPKVGLRLATRDGRASWPLIALLEPILAGVANESWRMVAPRVHVPRVTIDRLVVQRRAWRFQRSDLSFPDQTSLYQRFVGATRWRRDHRLPRHVFVKLDSEPKPLLLDFESAHSVEALAHTARRAGTLSVQEMLPGPGDLWLTDPLGRRLTSELRLVVIDRAARG